MAEPVSRWRYEKEVFAATGSFDKNEAAIIVDVASGSPAEEIGLKVGDGIISFDGVPANAQSDLDITASATTSKYQFYIPHDSSILQIEIDPMPIGIKIEPGSALLVKAFKAGNFPGWDSWDGLRLLWQRREWDQLLQASDTVFSNTDLSRLIRKVFKGFGKNTGMLYTGAALFEMDREEEGIELISDYIENDYIRSDVQIEHAIAYFYAAKWCGLVGKEDDQEHWLQQADRSNGGRFLRITHEVYAKGIELGPDRYGWIGKEFPVDYSLQIVDNGATVSLSETLANMQSDQLLPICVMPSYRGNGPYSADMDVYGSIYNYISNRILPMHIVLDTLDKEGEQDWWHEGEERLTENGIPFVLLHDPDSSVSDVLELETTPTFYFLNKQAAVVYEGPLDTGFDYWAVLGGARDRK